MKKVPAIHPEPTKEKTEEKVTEIDQITKEEQELIQKKQKIMQARIEKFDSAFKKALQELDTEHGFRISPVMTFKMSGAEPGFEYIPTR